jgi:hydroxymethylpyrimidine/phosphomethylpyrimidine kinase
MKAVLVIAGSDSVAGAGVQADLKTMAALGVYGVCAVTAVTAQSTTGVEGVETLSPDLVRSQIALVTADVEIAAVKTGMLASAAIVTSVAEAIARHRFAKVVVDPVMKATSGGTLLAPDAVSIMKTQLLPLALVVTPNVAEASLLSGITVTSLGTARDAAMKISELGPAAVVVKGGHLSGEHAIDVVFHAGRFSEVTAPRAPVGAVHGAGCTFASAVASRLALGDDVPEAIERAKAYVTGAIGRALRIGRGAVVLDHFWQSRERAL